MKKINFDKLWTIEGSRTFVSQGTAEAKGIVYLPLTTVLEEGDILQERSSRKSYFVRSVQKFPLGEEPVALAAYVMKNL